VPRSQKKRAARASAASGVAPAPRTAPSQVVRDTPEDSGPQPWSRRSLLILAGLVGALQLPLALLDLVRGGHRHNYGVYLIASLTPISLAQQLQILIAFVIVMPVARWLGREQRSMGLMETLGLGAVTLILLTILWQFALIVGPVDKQGNVSAAALAAGAVADVAGLALGVVVYPRIQRWFRARGLRR
jgi:hypothetical protein